MIHTKTGALIAAAIASIVWGFSFLSIKVAIVALGPMTLGLVRFIIASVLLYAGLKWKEPNTRLRREDIPQMILAGCIGITLYFFFENNGVKLIPASNASLIVAAVPVFTLVADALVLKNPLTKLKICSVFMSIVGVYFVVSYGVSGLEAKGSLLGYLLMFGAMLAWVIYCLITRSLFEKYSKLAVTCYQTIYGMLAFIPFALFEPLKWRLIDSVVVLNVLFLGVFCSAVAYYLYLLSMDSLGVNVSALILNLVPVVGVIASWLILGEHLSLIQIIGGLVVIGAVFISQWQPKIPTNSRSAECINEF